MGVAALFRIPFFRMREPRDLHGATIAGVAYRSAVSALEEAGFWVLREGAHVVMTDGTRILTIPCQDPVNGRTMEGIVRDAGLSTEQFRQLL